ncbi:DUF4133 domain-containing protein [Hymenobacter latericus]|uniref:DUF4133 domain-containing protein n=1 Tax=Hymenobacter sp. YIM 151858-1 TaxID=2987688 RepID=UPI002226D2BB|nr:DUF4133 domain-containing protein [Hymenobacter sp. YIM 151858-1]UYZ61149.1 DUF4133 domain-containing protein [Hymenobacter sp. YIM 151858-1]
MPLPINKGIGKPVEFKGLVGIYLAYLAAGLGTVFVLALGLLVAGVNSYLVALLTLGLGGLVLARVFALNRRHGEFGALKARARRRQPRRIVSRHPRLFLTLTPERT